MNCLDFKTTYPHDIDDWKLHIRSYNIFGKGKFRWFMIPSNATYMLLIIITKLR